MRRRIGSLGILVASATALAGDPQAPVWPASAGASSLRLERPAQAGSFFDVVGRRSAAFGYEGRGLEAWAYPLQVLSDFKLAFKVEGYPLEFDGADVLSRIEVRPESTTFTYSHAAFTARQTIVAPVDEPAVLVLVDVRSVLPMTLLGSFRPRLKLMWPAGLMTGNLEWDRKKNVYAITEESKKYAAIVGAPGMKDLAVMPYQEEPRDVPIRFAIDVPADAVGRGPIPLVIVAGIEGREKAQATYERLVSSAREAYEKTAAYYRDFDARTLQIETPDARLNQAFAWAKVGVDKGFATNPLLGTGLLAGYRTAGESERPGFGWFFGRDAVWTSLAINAYGDFPATRTALDFLRKFQRADGKIPHEISQSASLIPWFTDYKFPWDSADATPLYVIGHGDYYRATGDVEYLKASWPSIVRAYRFSAATDRDGNRLIENTKIGHAWVEGGGLYPPHEEIYLQGAWIEACVSLAEMATAMRDGALAREAREQGEATRAAMEKTYWLADRGYYAFATMRPPEKPREADPGPNRERRQKRMDFLDKAPLVDENTVLPAVPLWWRLLDGERAQSQIDHLGSGALATDWGHRILSDASELYDPLSYHNGSVWPLFTGWASMAAYRHGRPHVGYQALMANALLTEPGSLGYITELLSGDFNAPFGRSSHHQIWSEAMVIAPLVRGLLGIEAKDGGRTLRIAPTLPANWDRVALRNVAAGGTRYDVHIERAAERLEIAVAPLVSDLPKKGPGGVARFELAPALPLDARVASASIDGRSVPFKSTPLGDRQIVAVSVESATGGTASFEVEDGTDVYADVRAPLPGASSEGLRILRSRAEGGVLRLVLEGLAGRAYPLRVRTRRTIRPPSGVTIQMEPGQDPLLLVRFEGTGAGYVRREIRLGLE